MRSVVGGARLEALLAQWDREAAFLEELGLAPAAAFRRCARELREALQAEASQGLTLEEASAESGYDKDSLTRLIRTGRLANVGKKGAPRVRRADLPRKPVASPGPGLTPRALMRIVRSERRTS